MMINVTDLQFILYIIITMAGIITIKKLLEHLNQTTAMDKYEIDINQNYSVEDIVTELSNFVNFVFLDYTVMNIEVLQVDYVDENLENKIYRDVTDICSKRMSPIFINKLCLVYDISEINDILAEKVFLFTTQYVIDKNRMLKSKK